VTNYLAGERELLEAVLDTQRTEIVELLDGLGEEDARLRLVPSLTTPLGLVKHATFVEKVWFHSRIAGVSRAELGLPDEVDESYALAPSDTVASVRRTFVAACEQSRQIAAAAALDDEYLWHGHRVSLRFVYLHMIQELARHAGHGDILVEQIVERRGR